MLRREQDPLKEDQRLLQQLKLEMNMEERTNPTPYHYYYYYFFFIFIFYFFFAFCFLGLQPWHTEVPRLGVKSQLQLPAYTTATATQDPSQICDLHHSSRQQWILNPLREVRDRTRNLMVLSWICFCCTTTETLG